LDEIYLIVREKYDPVASRVERQEDRKGGSLDSVDDEGTGKTSDWREQGEPSLKEKLILNLQSEGDRYRQTMPKEQEEGLNTLCFYLQFIFAQTPYATSSVEMNRDSKYRHIRQIHFSTGLYLYRLVLGGFGFN